MTAVAACRVERLRLHRFRAWYDDTVELGPRLTVVTGRNAQGKTTLLEAIATLALTRSPRTATTSELIRWNEPTATVQARIARPDGPVALEMRIDRSTGDRAVRRTTVDGTERPVRDLLGICPVVLFQPEDLGLVRGSPEGRRRLLDIVLSQLDRVAAAELVRYRRVLDQRNALLRGLRLGTSTSARAALDAFTAELVRCGAAVQVARARLTAELAPLAASALDELSDGGEQLGAVYAAEGLEQPVAMDAETQAEAFGRALRARSTEELARGTTVLGPHRDDVVLTLDGRTARTAGSQGQQRSVVLALKLAEMRHLAGVAGMAPVLLLDDVLSELDAGRRDRLCAGLVAAGGQVLITTTEPGVRDLAVLGPALRLHIDGGRSVPPPEDLP